MFYEEIYSPDTEYYKGNPSSVLFDELYIIAYKVSEYNEDCKPDCRATQ